MNQTLAAPGFGPGGLPSSSLWPILGQRAPLTVVRDTRTTLHNLAMPFPQAIAQVICLTYDQARR